MRKQFGRQAGSAAAQAAQAADAATGSPPNVLAGQPASTEQPSLAGLRGRRRLMLFGLALAAAVAALYLPAESPEAGRETAARQTQELISGKGPIGGPFTLTDQHGSSRSLGEFRGKLVLLYFGYTQCADLCPADMMTIGRLLASLGREARALQPLFVTLDPERDTPAVLGKYVLDFHPRFIALRGGERETRRVATAYKIHYEKLAPTQAGRDVIEHTGFVFLLDKEGRYLAAFPSGTGVERIAARVREALAKPA